MHNPDDATVLLVKAFGDLDTRPFAWCFDPFDGADDHLNGSNTMIAAAAAADDDDDIFAANDPILEYAEYPAEAFRAPPTASAPSVTDQAPQEGVTYTMTGDEFLLMLRQHLGMPDDA